MIKDTFDTLAAISDREERRAAIKAGANMRFVRIAIITALFLAASAFAGGADPQTVSRAMTNAELCRIYCGGCGGE